jgi:hypothetical protein
MKDRTNRLYRKLLRNNKAEEGVMNTCLVFLEYRNRHASLDSDQLNQAQ